MGLLTGCSEIINALFVKSAAYRQTHQRVFERNPLCGGQGRIMLSIQKFWSQHVINYVNQGTTVIVLDILDTIVMLSKDLL